MLFRSNPEDYEYGSLDELIDIMCATRDEMENEGKYLVVNKNDNSIEASMVRDEIRERPIEQL